MTETIELTPGVYKGVPEDQYFALPAVNASTLKLLARSPAHCRARLDGLAVEVPTAAQLVGRALHAAVLEPDRFGRDFLCEPRAEDHDALVGLDDYKVAAKSLGLKVSGTKASLKSSILEADASVVFWEDRRAEIIGDRTVLKPNDWEMCESVMAAIQASPRASRALSGGEAELTLVWKDRATGLMCKARLDYYRDDLGVVLDLKSTLDARYSAVQRDVAKYDYHVSAAHYLNGLAALGLPCSSFGWVFVEKLAPYALGLFVADDDMLLRGREAVSMLLGRYAECKASGEWPAYSLDFQTLELPAWAAL